MYNDDYRGHGESINYRNHQVLLCVSTGSRWSLGRHHNLDLSGKYKKEAMTKQWRKRGAIAAGLFRKEEMSCLYPFSANEPREGRWKSRETEKIAEEIERVRRTAEIAENFQDFTIFFKTKLGLLTFFKRFGSGRKLQKGSMETGFVWSKKKELFVCWLGV